MPDLAGDQIGLPILSLASTENAGAVPASTLMTAVAAGAANTKGSWVQLIASTAKRATWLLLETALNGINATSCEFLLDIGTGGAGSEVVLIPNIRCKAADSQVGRVVNSGFLVPVEIPAGTRIAVRCQSATGSATIYVQAIMPEDPQQPSGFPLAFASPSLGTSKFEAAGVNTATSLGTTLTSNASANTKGTWAQLIASTASETVWIVVALCSIVGGSQFMVDIGIGTSVLVANLYYGNYASYSPCTFIALPVRIPAGSQIQARCQDIAGAKTVDISITLVERN